MSAIATTDDLRTAKRSYFVHEGGRTSIILEEIFWEMVDAKCEKLNMPWQMWLQEMYDLCPPDANFSSFVRTSLVKSLIAKR